MAQAFQPVLLAIIILCFFWKLVFTAQYTWLENPDAAYQILPWFQFQAREWHQGHFPLWDPYHWGGQTLIGQMLPGAAYPPNWILFLLPLKDGFIRESFVNWYFVLIHVPAALFCYFLCRDLGRTLAASLLGGMAFGLAGYVGTTGWPQMLNGVAWAPAVFLFQLRALRGERPVQNAALSGACLGIALLSGHHQAPVFIALGAGTLWLTEVYHQRHAILRPLLCCAVFAIFVLLAGGLQILPAYEYGKLARRWVGLEQPVGWNDPVPYSVHSDYSLEPAGLAGIALPGVHALNDPYTGLVLLTLAFLGIVWGWQHAAVRRICLLALAGLLLALGRSSVFHGVAYAALPFVEKARTPLAAFGLTSLAISVLAAYGADSLSDLKTTVWPKHAAMALTALGVALFGIASAFSSSTGVERLPIAALVALFLAALLFAWSAGHLERSTALTLLVALALLELGSFIGIYLPNRYDKHPQRYVLKLHENSDIAAFLRPAPGPFRIEVDPKEIPYNFGDWYGIDQFGGYVTSLPENLLRQDWPSTRVRDKYGVRYYLARAPRSSDQTEVFRGASGLKVFLNPEAWPRAWTTHPAPCGAADQVKSLARQANYASFEVRMACPGRLVISDNYFPGWRAWIDGRPAWMEQVEGSLRGVDLSSGKHRVEMTYRPVSVILGACMTVLGLACAAALRLSEFYRCGYRRCRRAAGARLH